jgi:hypothetical protein
MRHIIALAVLFMVANGTAFCQDSVEQGSRLDRPINRGNGYISRGGAFAVESQPTGNFGFGADIRIWRGLGAGGEIGLIASGGDAFGMASLNTSYQFIRSPFRQKGMVPFITGGYTSGSTGEASSIGANVGGGVNWWFRERMGLRFEVRDYCFKDEVNQVVLRVGISFR